MENLLITATDETPLIDFKSDGNLLIKGVSIPENINNFYKPIVDWLGVFEKNLPSAILLQFEIEYINTSSTRVLMDIVKKIDAFKSNCPNTQIVWTYDEEDDDNYDLGIDLEYGAKSKFIFKTI
jgi:hypothetical protein